MSVQSEINRISGNVTAALAAIAEKGVTVDSGSTSDDLATLIAGIEAGGGDAVKMVQGSITYSESPLNLDLSKDIVVSDGKLPNIAIAYFPESQWSNNADDKAFGLSIALLTDTTPVETNFNSTNGVLISCYKPGTNIAVPLVQKYVIYNSYGLRLTVTTGLISVGKTFDYLLIWGLPVTTGTIGTGGSTPI